MDPFRDVAPHAHHTYLVSTVIKYMSNRVNKVSLYAFIVLINHFAFPDTGFFQRLPDLFLGSTDGIEVYELRKMLVQGFAFSVAIYFFRNFIPTDDTQKEN